MRPSSSDISFMLDGASGTQAMEANQLDCALPSIHGMTSMDVEMQVPFTERWTVIVLDTNILLEFLDVIQTFVSEAEQQKLPVLIIIPGAVIHELDVQKNRDRLSWFARRASSWLLKKVKERKSVKGQALDETCKSSGNWKVKERGEELGGERENDGLILDCCQYFDRDRRYRTLLCSRDKLLAVEAESVGIPTLYPNQGSFCSRDLALAVFGPEAVMLQFSGRFPSYHGNTIQDSVLMRTDDNDGMDVDDDPAVTELVRPNHPLDQLHLQVIEHFGELLLELVAKVAGPEAETFGAAKMTSRHAPAYARKPLQFWTTADSLDFLSTKKAWPRSSPRVEVFLKRPYVNETGARRGQDWSRRDWEVALGTLGKIGDLWADGAGITESVHAVEAHVWPVFELGMRPTGVGLY